VRIANNIPALKTSITLRASDAAIVNTMGQLSTGSRINSAKNDAAGLAIANKLSIQVTGLNQASRNSMDGISLTQTADSSLNTLTEMIQRMRELAIQAANGALSPSDRSKMQMEVNQLIEEINDNAIRTEFNKIRLLSGEANTLSKSFIAPDALGDGIASVLYVSPSVPAGVLNYTIDSPGFPALASLDLATLVGSNVTFRLNEVGVSISQFDTIDVIRGKIADAANLAFLELKYDATGMTGFFATKTAGSTQSISITSTGMPSINTQASGTDAVLSNVGFFNPVNGLPVANFNSGVSVRANGNQVSVTSTGGQVIRLGLKVFFSPQGNGNPIEDFVFGNGTVGATPPYSDGDPVNAPVDMIAQIKDFGHLMLHIGPNFNHNMAINIPRLDAETLGLVEFTGGAMKIIMEVQSIAGATRAIEKMDKALADVTQVRSWIGAYQNRLEQTVMNLDAASVNTDAARSRIQDTDMAAAMTELSKYNTKYQAGLAILAQANQRPQQILSLLQ